MAFYRLTNKIQNYAWGSRTAISGLLGGPPSDQPEAELWMGTHLKGESEVFMNGRSVPLSKLLTRDPDGVLGVHAARGFSDSLPFLLKVLAAEQPLSIQAHPDKDRASAGFSRENQVGMSLDDPGRNYRDAHHKPELICALQPFAALNGFRPIEQLTGYIESYCPDVLGRELELLRKSRNNEGLKHFFNAVMNFSVAKKEACVAETVRRIGILNRSNLEETWALRLYERYPQDIGVLAPFLLNLVVLQPGQAMFLPAGKLHAYLHGLGIEVMASSDNVIRGGLTPKHVDVPELMSVLEFEGRAAEVMEPEPVDEFESVYRTPADEFELSVISIDNAGIRRNCSKSAEILLCVRGEAGLSNEESSIQIEKGISVFIPASANQYRIEGSATIYRALIPHKVRI